MDTKKIVAIRDAQLYVKAFMETNKLESLVDVEKLDRLHEDLVAVAKGLENTSPEARKKFIAQNRTTLQNIIGELLFSTCEFSNQADVDLAEAFNATKDALASQFGERAKKPEISAARPLKH